MAFPLPFRKHARLRNQLDAYVDGELEGPGRLGLDRHLAACHGCREIVAARQQVKRLAASLPELPAPRSFRITPGMLVEAQHSAPARSRSSIPARLGQVTAAVASVAFAAVLVVHLTAPGDDGGGSRATDADTMAVQPADSGAAAESTDTANDFRAPQPEPTPGIPGFTGATVGGASNPPTETPGMQDEGKAYEGEGLGGAAPPAAPDQGQPAALYDAPARADEDRSNTVFLVAEAALGTLVLAAVATWLISRRSRGA